MCDALDWTLNGSIVIHFSVTCLILYSSWFVGISLLLLWLHITNILSAWLLSLLQWSLWKVVCKYIVVCIVKGSMMFVLSLNLLLLSSIEWLCGKPLLSMTVLIDLENVQSSHKVLKKVSGFWSEVAFKIGVVTHIFYFLFVWLSFFFCQPVKYVIHVHMIIGTRPDFPYTWWLREAAQIRHSQTFIPLCEKVF